MTAGAPAAAAAAPGGRRPCCGGQQCRGVHSAREAACREGEGEGEGQPLRCAWAIYADSPTFFEAALVLYQSLRDAGTAFSMVLMHPEGATFELPPGMAAGPAGARPAGVILRPVARLDRAGSAYLHGRYNATLNKLHIWGLTEFDRVCWLDADMLAVGNIDEIFGTDLGGPDHDIAAARGCLCNVFGRPELPSLPRLCPFNDGLAGGAASRAGSGRPGPGARWGYINTGVVLVKPCAAMFDRVLAQDFDYPFPDQDALNVIFEGRIALLPSRFNYLNHLPLAHPELPRDFAVFHFGYGKPWDANVLGLNQAMYERWAAVRARVRVAYSGAAPAAAAGAADCGAALALGGRWEVRAPKAAAAAPPPKAVEVVAAAGEVCGP